jgi:hypothetical protein
MDNQDKKSLQSVSFTMDNHDKKSLIQSVSFTMGYSEEDIDEEDIDEEDIDEEEERKKNETLEFFRTFKVDPAKLAGFNKLIGS